MSDTPDYRPPGMPPRRRSIGAWLILIVVWCAGILMWTIYFIAILYLVFRIF